MSSSVNPPVDCCCCSCCFNSAISSNNSFRSGSIVSLDDCVAFGFCFVSRAILSNSASSNVLLQLICNCEPWFAISFLASVNSLFLAARFSLCSLRNLSSCSLASLRTLSKSSSVIFFCFSSHSSVNFLLFAISSS